MPRARTVANATHQNAMSEIALALAMAFFSILVLALVSIGAPAAPRTAAIDPGVAVKPSAPTPSAAARTGGKAVAADSLIVFHRGRFFDAGLVPVDPARAALARVLAVDPALSMTDALAARDKIGRPDVTVTTLDERWLARLKEISR